MEHALLEAYHARITELEVELTAARLCLAAADKAIADLRAELEQALAIGGRR